MDLMFYNAKHGNWADKAVSWWTWGPYSHTEIRFPDGQCFSASPREKLVRFKKINVIPEHWNIISLPLEEIPGVREWCETQVGKKYDWLGILGFAFFKEYDAGMNHPNAWYCSEICGEILRQSGWEDIPRKLSPNKLYRLVKDKPPPPLVR